MESWELVETKTLSSYYTTFKVPDGGMEKLLALEFIDVSVTANATNTPFYITFNADGGSNYIISNINANSNAAQTYDTGTKAAVWLTPASTNNRLIDGKIIIGRGTSNWRDGRGNIVMYDTTASVLYNIINTFYWKNSGIITSITVAVDNPASFTGTVILSRL